MSMELCINHLLFMLLTENRLFAQMSQLFIDIATLNKNGLDKAIVPHSSRHFITKWSHILAGFKMGQSSRHEPKSNSFAVSI